MSRFHCACGRRAIWAWWTMEPCSVCRRQRDIREAEQRGWDMAMISLMTRHTDQVDDHNAT